MRSIFFTSCLFLIGLSLNGQSWISSTQISGTDDLNVIKAINDINENTIILGQFLGEIDLGAGESLISYGSRDYFLLKFDSNGALDWGTNIGGTATEYVLGGVGTNQNGDIYVSGAFANKAYFSPTDSIVGIQQDIFLAKYTTEGNLEWYKNAGTGGKYQRPNTLTINDSGNILLSGFFLDSIEFNETTTLYSENSIADYFYSEFDSDGNLTWVKQIKTSHNPLSGRVFNIQANSSYLTMTGSYSDTVVIEDKIMASDSLVDVHLIRTNLAGDLQWVRSIGGKGYVYSYNITYDDSENVYVAGYFNSPSLTIDSTETDQVTVVSNNGGYDTFVAKFNSEGTFQWIRTNGGVSDDKIFDIEYFNQEINISGYFTDSISWGEPLKANGDSPDRDMLTGSLDLEGKYRNGTSFGGVNGSWEEAYSISTTADEKVYNVIRSNSDTLILGNKTHISENGKYYLVLGVVGCRNISVDFVIPTDVNTCYGDSTGTIQVSASGGFGSPWKYSIDNGDSFHSDLSLFSNVPAGVYQIVVKDSEGCSQSAGETVSVNQPDQVLINVLSTANITPISDGHIEVEASGGSIPYTYMLQPDSTLQGIGTFTFAQGDSGSYVVEVKDAKGCGPMATDTIDILEEVCQTITVEVTDTSDITSGGPGKIVVSASGGTSPYTYSITPETGVVAVDSMFEISIVGDYTVEVNDAWNCGPVSTELITISDLTIGITNYMYAEASVYPNPSNGEITIEMSTEASRNTIEVMSMTGQVLVSTMVYPSGGQLKETLHLGDLAKGMYMLRVDGKMLRSAIVLQ